MRTQNAWKDLLESDVIEVEAANGAWGANGTYSIVTGGPHGITYDGMCGREPTAARTDSGSAAKWVMCDGIGATRGWFGRASNNFGCNLYMRAFPSYLATSPRVGSVDCAERLTISRTEVAHE